jgi:hypothetical protein
LALTRERPPAEDAPTTTAEIIGIRLADDVVHVTYLSRRDQRSARRSSIWLRTGSGWRLYFHQGTLTQSAKEAAPRTAEFRGSGCT